MELGRQFEGRADAYLSRLVGAINELDKRQVDNALQVISDAWERGSQIITCGNGGSAMTAQHFITDWAKMIPMSTGKSFLGRSLLDNMGILTAYANDVSYEDIFKCQLENILRPNDLLIAISGSGNSENIIRAVDYANNNGAITLGLCGYSGGKLKDKAQHKIWVNVHDMQICEDIHAMFGHIVMKTFCGDKCGC